MEGVGVEEAVVKRSFQIVTDVPVPMAARPRSEIEIEEAGWKVLYECISLKVRMSQSLKRRS